MKTVVFTLGALLATMMTGSNTDSADEASVKSPEAAIVVRSNVVNAVRSDIFGGNITWIDYGYNIWDAKTNRPDPAILQKLKDTGITNLRYPGGCEGDYFHWAQAIGDSRTPQPHPFSHEWPTRDTERGVPYYPYFGPDEFSELCKAADITATIQLNAGTGAPQEAADYVRYCIDHGFQAAFFDVGNEPHLAGNGWELVPNIPIVKTPEEYVAFFNGCWSAVQSFAPQAKLGAVGLPTSHPLLRHSTWQQVVISQLADKMAYLDVHCGYAPYFKGEANDRDAALAFLAASKQIRAYIEEVKQELARYAPSAGPKVNIHITEYGPLGWPIDRTIVGGLCLAGILQELLCEPRITAANHLPTLNTPKSPTLIGVCDENFAPIPGRRIWDNVATYVFRLYAEMIGRDVLDVHVESATFDSPAVGLTPAQTGAPLVAAAAYHDAPKGYLSVFLINRNLDAPLSISVDTGFVRAKAVRETIIKADDYLAFNDWGHPRMVIPETNGAADIEVKSGVFHMTLAKHSLTRIDFTSAHG